MSGQGLKSEAASHPRATLEFLGPNSWAFGAHWGMQGRTSLALLLGQAGVAALGLLQKTSGTSKLFMVSATYRIKFWWIFWPKHVCLQLRGSVRNSLVGSKVGEWGEGAGAELVLSPSCWGGGMRAAGRGVWQLAVANPPEFQCNYITSLNFIES